MKKAKFLIVTILLLVLFTSCKKEDPTEEIIDVFTVELEVNETEFEIENNQVIELEDPYELGFHVKNNTSKSIRIKLTVVSLQGNGNGVELCFSQCRSNTTEGLIDIRNFTSGEKTTTNQAHLNPGDDFEESLTVEFKLNQVDSEGEDVVDGKEVSFTYKYIAPK